jgi:hypothetical protein
MDITYIEELVKEYEKAMSNALSKVMSRTTTDMAEYHFYKGRYHAYREMISTLKDRHAID